MPISPKPPKPPQKILNPRSLLAPDQKHTNPKPANPGPTRAGYPPPGAALPGAPGPLGGSELSIPSDRGGWEREGGVLLCVFGELFGGLFFGF